MCSSVILLLFICALGHTVVAALGCCAIHGHWLRAGCPHTHGHPSKAGWRVCRTVGDCMGDVKSFVLTFRGRVFCTQVTIISLPPPFLSPCLPALDVIGATCRP